MKIKDLAKIVGGYCCDTCLNDKANMINIVYGDELWEACATNHVFRNGWNKEEKYKITRELITALKLVFPPIDVDNQPRINTDGRFVHTVRGKQVAEFIREYYRKHKQ